MADIHNVFISHFNDDDESLHSLKKRLNNIGCTVRNSSIEKKDYRDKRVSDKTIATELRAGIKWAGTVIVLIGEHTHERPWVNYEIRNAYLQGKNIVGIFKNGCKDKVELPEAFKRYGGATLGWRSLDKLNDIMNGKCPSPESPSGNPREPIYNIIHIKC